MNKDKFTKIYRLLITAPDEEMELVIGLMLGLLISDALNSEQYCLLVTIAGATGRKYFSTPGFYEMMELVRDPTEQERKDIEQMYQKIQDAEGEQ